MKKFSIWIEKEENGFDVNVWDEVNNERAEELEVYSIPTIIEANKKLQKIITSNSENVFEITHI